MNNHFCIRYQQLNNDEPAPYAKICKLIIDYNDQDKEEALYYIQVSEDEKNPHWMRAGEMFEHAFKHKFEDRRFMKKCMNLYKKSLCEHG